MADMGQARATRAEGTPDLVITGAVVLDYWGMIKVAGPGVVVSAVAPDAAVLAGRLDRGEALAAGTAKRRAELRTSGRGDRRERG